MYDFRIAQPLPRAYRRQLDALDREKVQRIVAEAGEPEMPESAVGATAAGDERRLRGIPAVGRGSSFTMPGTDPLRELLRKERRRRPRGAL